MPNGWLIRIAEKDYPVDSLETLASWRIQRRVPDNGEIFDPRKAAWVKVTDFFTALLSTITATTTPSVEGSRIARYLGIESVEVVPGTGLMAELRTGLEDLLGRRSGDFEQMLQQAKRLALEHLLLVAFLRGANAVVGVDLDYTEFSNNRVAVIASGTLVQVERT